MPRKKKAPTVKTQIEFDKNKQSLTGNAIKEKAPRKKKISKTIEVEDVVEKTPPYTQQVHTNKISSFNSYIIKEDDYFLHTLYKLYYKSKKNLLKRAGFHAGSIIYRAMGEYERRCSFYLNTTEEIIKEELKEAICADLDVLKNKIMEM
mgnify:CR=1 FL=1|tara:strand:+ start:16 stop:462 length:447 start_codon:yes stop_codon:yes gene_type:complete